MIRCVLADDHVLARELLCKAMEQTSTIRIVGDYGDAREAAEYAVDQKVDVLILAVNIPGSSPFEAARWAKASHFPLKTLFLTGSTEEEHVLNAIEAGASGYLIKTCGLDDLQRTINESLAEGDTRFVINLSEVPMIDSSGIGVLVRFLTSAKRRGGNVKLVNLSSFAQKTLRVVGVLGLFDVYEDDDQAVASFS